MSTMNFLSLRLQTNDCRTFVNSLPTTEILWTALNRQNNDDRTLSLIRKSTLAMITALKNDYGIIFSGSLHVKILDFQTTYISRKRLTYDNNNGLH
jgi:hypothetical protein